MESELGKKIQVALSSVGARVFRNNVGLAWIGRSTRHHTSGTATVRPGDVIIHEARPFHAGLCEGSCDYIGYKTVTITPDMVGQRVAIFTGVEVKTSKGRVSEAQQTFIDVVRQAGGIAFVARSEEDAKKGMVAYE